MKRDQIEQLEKEEKELEEKMLSAPTGEETTKPIATEVPTGAEETPAKEKESVAPEPKSATDEQTEPKKVEDWEKRYKNLRSSRDMKLYETKSQLSAALTTINGLQAQIQELRVAQPKVDPLEGVFTEEDTNALGDATVDAMRRVTQKATEAATRPLQEQLDIERTLRTEQTDRLAQQTKQEAYNIFISRVSKAVPDWERINYEDGFEAFLNEADVDGTQRKVYFSAAEDQGNAAQVIRYMQEYTSIKPKDKLADKITPTGEAAGATQVKEEGGKVETISQADINKFYDDLNRGKYKGRHTEALGIEAAIDKATMEGRIVR